MSNDDSQRGVTLADVARRAGVSQKTASLALRHRIGGRATVKAVTDAARELRYQSRKGQAPSNNLLVVTPLDINPTYFPELLDKLMQRAAAHGLDVVHVPYSIHRPLDYTHVRTMMRGRLAGAVLIGTVAAEAWYKMLRRDSISIVAVSTTKRPDLGPKGAHVLIGTEGIEQAAAHVSLRRPKRVGYIAGPGGSTSNAVRRRAITDALRSRNLTIDAESSCRDNAQFFRAGFDGCVELLSAANPPEVVFAYNDVVAFGALAALHQLPKTGARSTWIIGHDDLTFAEYAQPSLASIRVDREELARKIIDQVDSLSRAARVEDEAIRTVFIPRDSAKL